MTMRRARQRAWEKKKKKKKKKVADNRMILTSISTQLASYHQQVYEYWNTRYCRRITIISINTDMLMRYIIQYSIENHKRQHEQQKFVRICRYSWLLGKNWVIKWRACSHFTEEIRIIQFVLTGFRGRTPEFSAHSQSACVCIMSTNKVCRFLWFFSLFTNQLT